MPGCRFHALYDKVYLAHILNHVYNPVCANRCRIIISFLSFSNDLFVLEKDTISDLIQKGSDVIFTGKGFNHSVGVNQ